MFKQKGCLLNTGLRYGKSTYGGRQVDNTSQITDLLLCCLHGYITEKSDKNDVSSPNGTQWLTDKTKGIWLSKIDRDPWKRIGLF